MLEAHQPFLKRLSPEERQKLLYQAVDVADRGDDDEYDRLSCMFPVNPQSANDLKKSIGIEALIASGLNLIEAVDEYGEEWLTN